MAILSIILMVIEAIPSIIKLVQDVIDLIHGHPLEAVHEHAFRGIFLAWRDHKDPAKVEADLQALHVKLTSG